MFDPNDRNEVESGQPRRHYAGDAGDHTTGRIDHRRDKETVATDRRLEFRELLWRVLARTPRWEVQLIGMQVLDLQTDIVGRGRRLGWNVLLHGTLLKDKGTRPGTGALGHCRWGVGS